MSTKRELSCQAREKARSSFRTSYIESGISAIESVQFELFIFIVEYFYSYYARGSLLAFHSGHEKAVAGTFGEVTERVNRGLVIIRGAVRSCSINWPRPMHREMEDAVGRGTRERREGG